jgi:hypothetical protein
MMAKTPLNSGKPWTQQQNQQLRDLARHNKPTGLIAWQLGRSKASIYSHASEIGLSLKPTNQSPYNRRK